MGMFTDDACSVAVDDETFGASTFRSMTGIAMPYSERSLVGAECLSCTQVNWDGEDENNNNNNGEEQQIELTEACQMTYQMAGKCEPALEATGHVYEANENACNYIAGIKVIRKDGIITQVGSKANKTASIFIGIFVVAFVLLAAYVYYLKTKLDRASINLSE